MNEAWIGFLSAIVGALVVLVPAIAAIRKQPTRRTTDAITLLDSSGKVIGNLTDEIARLQTALRAAQDEAATYRSAVQQLRAEVEKRPTRDELLDENGRLKRQLWAEGITPDIYPTKGTT